MMPPPGGGPGGGKAGGHRAVPVAALLLLAVLFAGLGVWQVKRLAWKEALIAQVAAGLAGPAQDAARLLGRPAPAYRKLTATGHLEPAATTLVAASTRLGRGYWVLVPLRLADGRAIWVNRGFVPVGTRAGDVATPTGTVALLGLARLSEAGGIFARANHPNPSRPNEARWYTRDIAAIAAQAHVAGSETGWFLDAGLPMPQPRGAAGDDESLPAAPPPRATGATRIEPVPGLTVIRFANNHLAYALTWFGLAGLCLMGIGVVLRKAPPI